MVDLSAARHQFLSLIEDMDHEKLTKFFIWLEFKVSEFKILKSVSRDNKLYRNYVELIRKSVGGGCEELSLEAAHDDPNTATTRRMDDSPTMVTEAVSSSAEAPAGEVAKAALQEHQTDALKAEFKPRPAEEEEDEEEEVDEDDDEEEEPGVVTSQGVTMGGGRTNGLQYMPFLPSGPVPISMVPMPGYGYLGQRHPAFPPLGPHLFPNVGGSMRRPVSQGSPDHASSGRGSEKAGGDNTKGSGHSSGKSRSSKSGGRGGRSPPRRRSSVRHSVQSKYFRMVREAISNAPNNMATTAMIYHYITQNYAAVVASKEECSWKSTVRHVLAFHKGISRISAGSQRKNLYTLTAEAEDDDVLGPSLLLPREKKKTGGEDEPSPAPSPLMA